MKRTPETAGIETKAELAKSPEKKNNRELLTQALDNVEHLRVVFKDDPVRLGRVEHTLHSVKDGVANANKGGDYPGTIFVELERPDGGQRVQHEGVPVEEIINLLREGADSMGKAGKPGVSRKKMRELADQLEAQSMHYFDRHFPRPGVLVGSNPKLDNNESAKQNFRTQMEAYYIHTWTQEHPEYRTGLLDKYGELTTPQGVKIKDLDLEKQDYFLAMEVMRNRRELVLDDVEEKVAAKKTKKKAKVDAVAEKARLDELVKKFHEGDPEAPREEKNTAENISLGPNTRYLGTKAELLKLAEDRRAKGAREFRGMQEDLKSDIENIPVRKMIAKDQAKKIHFESGGSKEEFEAEELKKSEAAQVVEDEAVSINDETPETPNFETSEAEIDSNKVEQVINNEAAGDGEALFNDALKLVTEHGRASTSLLQRNLKLNYLQAFTLLERMIRDGYVGELIAGTRAHSVLEKAYTEAGGTPPSEELNTTEEDELAAVRSNIENINQGGPVEAVTISDKIRDFIKNPPEGLKGNYEESVVDDLNELVRKGGAKLRKGWDWFRSQLKDSGHQQYEVARQEYLVNWGITISPTPELEDELRKVEGLEDYAADASSLKKLIEEYNTTEDTALKNVQISIEKDDNPYVGFNSKTNFINIPYRFIRGLSEDEDKQEHLKQKLDEYIKDSSEEVMTFVPAEAGYPTEDESWAQKQFQDFKKNSLAQYNVMFEMLRVVNPETGRKATDEVLYKNFHKLADAFDEILEESGADGKHKFKFAQINLADYSRKKLVVDIVNLSKDQVKEELKELLLLEGEEPVERTKIRVDLAETKQPEDVVETEENELTEDEERQLEAIRLICNENKASHKIIQSHLGLSPEDTTKVIKKLQADGYLSNVNKETRNYEILPKAWAVFEKLPKRREGD